LFVALAFLTTGVETALLAQASDPELQKGIQQAREGLFDAAVITLDGVARRMAGQPGRAKELAQAYTYLAVAYLGLSQEQQAKAKFLEALKADNALDVTTREFPPKIVQFFEQARKEAQPQPKPAPAPSPTAAPAGGSGGKKGGSKLPFVLLGVAGAGGIAVVAAKGGGGDDPGPGPTPTPVVVTTTTTITTTTTTTTTTLAGCNFDQLRRDIDLASNSRTSFPFNHCGGQMSGILTFAPTGGGDMVFFLSRDGTNSCGAGCYMQGFNSPLQLNAGNQNAGEFFAVVVNSGLARRTGEMRINFMSR
jgi:hypothetical protein